VWVALGGLEVAVEAKTKATAFELSRELFFFVRAKK
jgi:hypothetical protein